MSDTKNADLNAVIAELEEKVKELPGNFVAHHHLAMVYHKAGRHNDAIDELKKCIEIDDANAEAHINIGAIYFEEPCPFDHLEDTKRVTDELSIPVAGGEQEYSLRRFRWMISNLSMNRCTNT